MKKKGNRNLPAINYVPSPPRSPLLNLLSPLEVGDYKHQDPKPDQGGNHQDPKPDQGGATIKTPSKSSHARISTAPERYHAVFLSPGGYPEIRRVPLFSPKYFIPLFSPPLVFLIHAE